MSVWIVDLLGSVLICDGYFFVLSMPVWLFINCLGNKLIFISSLDTVGKTVETVETVEDGIKTMHVYVYALSIILTTEYVDVLCTCSVRTVILFPTGYTSMHKQ